MNDGGDCRTAPATPGLLKTNLYFGKQEKLQVKIVNNKSAVGTIV